MPAFETRTDSPEETPEGPQDPCQHWRGILRFRPRLHTRFRPRQRRERNPERPPRNSHGDWPFLRPPERVPEVPVPRIDSHHVCTWTALWESLVGKPRGKDSRRGPTPLGRLQKYPKIHVSTGEESSGSGPNSTQGLRPRHRRERNTERPPWNSHGDRPFLRPPERVPEGPVRNLFSLHCLDVQAEDRLPPRVHVDIALGKPRGKASWERLEGKNSRRSRRISRGGALHRKGERNSRVVPPFQESPRCVSPFQRNLFSLHCLEVQAEYRLPPRVHVGQPCGKASWESLVGKTRGKTIDPLIPAPDCETLLIPLWRKTQVHARIRNED
ncbi:hypothetical protein MJT46_008390 [Ovis ammon polii x Ovis aries]|nr:hypothetical protein MJT46_008390 [Ovis ammon polii x Ovis aries]